MILLYPNWMPPVGEQWQSMITLLVETESGIIDHAKLRSIAPLELAANYVHIERWAVLRVDPYDPNDQTQYDGYEYPSFCNEDNHS